MESVGEVQLWRRLLCSLCPKNLVKRHEYIFAPPNYDKLVVEMTRHSILDRATSLKDNSACRTIEKETKPLYFSPLNTVLSLYN